MMPSASSSLLASKLPPSLYRVWSPSKVMSRSSSPIAMICARFRMWRISLKDGAMNLLLVMEYLLSYILNATSSGKGVWKAPTVGTNSFSLLRSGFLRCSSISSSMYAIVPT